MIQCEKNLTFSYWLKMEDERRGQVKESRWLLAAGNDKDMAPPPEHPQGNTALPTSGF